MARPLVVRFGALGDMVLITPVLRALAERHGQPVDVVGIGGWLPILFAGLPWVGDIHCIGSRKTPYWINPDKWRMVRWIRDRQPSEIWNLQTDPLSRQLVRRTGLPITGDAGLLPIRPREHIVEYQARLISAPAAGDVELRVTADEVAACATWVRERGWDGRPLVLIQPGNHRSLRKGRLDEVDPKFWPPDRWVAVIRGVLAEQREAQVLIIGAPNEATITEALAQSCADPRVASVAHELPLRRLFALFTHAHSLLSVDTGPAHAAAAMACPVTVLFAAADPRQIRPFTRRSGVEVVYGPPGAPDPDETKAWIAAHRMEGITPDMVLAGWRRLSLRATQAS